MDVKNFPQTLSKLRVIYLQEFVMTASNPVCNMANYEDKMYKIFTGLLCLDGYRKSVNTTYNM